MKTGEVRDPGDGGGPRLEVDGWTPWLYHAPEDEIGRYYSAANAQMMKLERMPPAVRARLKRIEIRCPVKGCLLATVYRIPHQPTADDLERHRRFMSTVQAMGGPKTLAPEVSTYFYVGRTADGTEVYDIPFYGFSATGKDEALGRCTCCRMVYWRAGCRHGTASLERNAMLERFRLAERWHRPWETEEEELAKLPEDLRPLWGKRVFHPESPAWHPKKRVRTSDRRALHPSPISDPSGGQR